jgi:cob(I)alamin adenosyltransferase
MKIYTKTGDEGNTGILGGHRLRKHHIAISVVGDLDEANSFLGLAVTHQPPVELAEIVIWSQSKLFDIGARVAGCLDSRDRALGVAAVDSERLEQSIDALEQRLAPLTAFILPGGGPCGAHLHVARCIIRRTERGLVRLVDELNLAEFFAHEIVFLNRLADWLFVAARWSNQQSGQPETKWQPH